jgi:preprotein translocase subunit SecE
LQSYLTLRDEVSKIASWPFETQTVERLVAVLLAVFTVLMTRLLELAH